MIGGIGNLRAPGIFFPMEVRANISALRAASLAGKSRFQIGETHIIWPLVGAQRRPVAALVVGAIPRGFLFPEISPGKI